MISNYEVTRNKARELFLNYDQEKMIQKFQLKADVSYIYIEFVKRLYRIQRKTGVVEWSEDEFVTCKEANYDESMTIYDVLCYSKENCRLSGSYCSLNFLKGTVKSAPPGGTLHQKAAQCWNGKCDELKKICVKLGELLSLNGDVAAKLEAFSFLPVILQYWEADDEFEANLKFMFDENVTDFMHYETLYYMMGHIISRIDEMMENHETQH